MKLKKFMMLRLYLCSLACGVFFENCIMIFMLVMMWNSLCKLWRRYLRNTRLLVCELVLLWQCFLIWISSPREFRYLILVKFQTVKLVLFAEKVMTVFAFCILDIGWVILVCLMLCFSEWPYLLLQICARNSLQMQLTLWWKLSPFWLTFFSIMIQRCGYCFAYLNLGLRFWF